MDESQKSNIVKNDRQSGRFERFLVLMATFEMNPVKLNVLADFSICTIITTRLTKNILKDAISDLTTARIFKDVCPSTCRVPKRFNWEGFHFLTVDITSEVTGCHHVDAGIAARGNSELVWKCSWRYEAS